MMSVCVGQSSEPVAGSFGQVQQDQMPSTSANISNALLKAVGIVCDMIEPCGSPARREPLLSISQLHPHNGPYLMIMSREIFGESIENVDDERITDVLEWLKCHMTDAIEGKRAVICEIEPSTFPTMTPEKQSLELFKIGTLLFLKLVFLEGEDNTLMKRFEQQMHPDEVEMLKVLLEWFISEAADSWASLDQFVAKAGEQAPEDYDTMEDDTNDENADPMADMFNLPPEVNVVGTRKPSVSTVSSPGGGNDDVFTSANNVNWMSVTPKMPITPKMHRRQSLAATRSQPVTRFSHGVIPAYTMPAPIRKFDSRLKPKQSTSSSRSVLASDSEDVSFTGTPGSPLQQWTDSPGAIRQKQREQQKTIKQLRGRLNEMAKRNHQLELNLEDQRAKHADTYNGVKERLDRALERNREHDVLLTKLQAAEAEVEHRRHENAELKNRLNAWEQKYATLSEESQKGLFEADVKNGDLTRQLEEARAQNVRYKDTIEELACRDTISRAQQLEHQQIRVEMEARLAQCQKDVEEYKDKYEASRTTVTSRIDKLEDEKLELQAELFEVRSNLASVTQERDKLNDELPPLRQELQAAKKMQVAHEQTLNGRIIQLQNELDKQKKESDEERTKTERLQLTEAQLQAQVEQLQSQLQTAESQLDIATKQLLTTRQAAKTSTSRLSMVEVESKTRLNAADEELRVFRSRVHEMQLTIKQLTAQNDELTEAKTMTEKELSNVRIAQATFDQKLFEVESALTKCHTELGRTTHALNEKNKLCEELTGKSKELQGQLKDAQTNTEQQQKHIDKLNADIEEKSASHADVLERITSLESELMKHESSTSQLVEHVQFVLNEMNANMTDLSLPNLPDLTDLSECDGLDVSSDVDGTAKMLTVASNAVQCLVQHVKTLQMQVDTHQNTIHQINTEKEALDAQIAELSGHLTEERDKVHKLQESAFDLQQKLTAQFEENQEVQEWLSHQLQEVQAKCDDVSLRLDDERDNGRRLETELIESMRREGHTVETLTAVKQTTGAQIKQLLHTIDGQHADHETALTKHVQQYDALTTLYAHVLAEFARAQTELKANREEINLAAENCKGMQENLDEIEELLALSENLRHSDKDEFASKQQLWEDEQTQLEMEVNRYKHQVESMVDTNNRVAASLTPSAVRKTFKIESPSSVSQLPDVPPSGSDSSTLQHTEPVQMTFTEMPCEEEPMIMESVSILDRAGRAFSTHEQPSSSRSMMSMSTSFMPPNDGRHSRASQSTTQSEALSVGPPTTAYIDESDDRHSPFESAPFHGKTRSSLTRVKEEPEIRTPEYDWKSRMSEFDERNKMVPPHLRSNYPLETMAAEKSPQPIKETPAVLRTTMSLGEMSNTTDENATPTTSNVSTPASQKSGKSKRLFKLMQKGMQNPFPFKSKSRPAQHHSSVSSRRPLTNDSFNTSGTNPSIQNS